MTYVTSGKLQYAEVKGLLRCTAAWWIDLGDKFKGLAFRLHDEDGREIARLSECHMHMLPGYLWDGSSGMTDDDGNLDPVPSGFHDIAYESLRERQSSYAPDERRSIRKLFDKVYDELLEERGMSKWLEPHTPDAWWKVWQLWRLLNPGYRTRYYGLRVFGGPSASRLRGPQYPKRAAA